ncbi:hypothetical protein [Chryseobacterium turcicum]|uniref:Uncharacterized protein n=1 Tax=Chryseobacterium turcicum TaxID=2898076 RepID=A0A9Q3YUN0_9FLAO|nr:hypothetical protein [Chryseobacterium turcicum]MCD1115918.1 hypothetical protein [Chryseobacterium turcicum]
MKIKLCAAVPASNVFTMNSCSTNLGNLWLIQKISAMYSVECINKIRSLLSFFLLGFLFLPSLFFSQQFKLKKDAQYINNYQIDVTANKNYVFVSSDGLVDIPLDSIKNISKLKIVDLDKNSTYDLYREELKVRNGDLYFTSGKLIDSIIIGNKKKEIIIGIEAKGWISNLYTIPERKVVVEIPIKGKNYEDKKIKKIKFYFTGGYNTLYNVKTSKKDIKIIPILYTCESVDCKDKNILIPEMEVSFTEKSKYLEVDVSHHDVFINKDFKNIYVGYITLDYFIVKQKKVDKIADNKCYNLDLHSEWFRESKHKCPVVSIVLE